MAKISEVIRDLQEILEEHGDLDLKYYEFCPRRYDNVLWEADVYYRKQQNDVLIK